MSQKLSQRTSQYLLSRIESLYRALLFFFGPDHVRWIIFLSQIDFWEWEKAEQTAALGGHAIMDLNKFRKQL